jgi:hypothetical protein
MYLWWNEKDSIMFIRAKKRDDKVYLQIVENERINGKVVQHIRLNLGRLDYLQESGKLDSLLKSGLRFSRQLTVLDAHAKGECTTTATKKIGPPLLFEKAMAGMRYSRYP